MDCIPPGSSVHGLPGKKYWSRLPFPLPGDLPDPEKQATPPALAGGFFTTTTTSGLVLSCFSSVWLFVILWATACQAPLSMGFSRKEYWSGLPFPSPGDLPDPGIKFVSLRLLQWQADSLPLTPPGKVFKYSWNYWLSLQGKPVKKSCLKTVFRWSYFTI